MKYELEEWRKIYLTDTARSLAYSPMARLLQWELLRKVNDLGEADVGRFPTRALANLMRVPVEWVEEALPQWIAGNADDPPLVEIVGSTLRWINFVPGQEARMAGSLRQRRYEARLRLSTDVASVKHDAASSNTDATSVNLTKSNTVLRGLTRPDDIDGDGDGDPNPHSPPPAPSARKRADSGTRLDSMWEPNDACRTLCKSLGLNLAHELELFRGYWCPLPGVRAKKLDWNLTFQTRLREQAARAMRSSGGRPQLAPVAKSPTHREFVPSPPFLFDENPVLNGKGH